MTGNILSLIIFIVEFIAYFIWISSTTVFIYRTTHKLIWVLIGLLIILVSVIIGHSYY